MELLNKAKKSIEITDEELESLDCPTFEKQDFKWKCIYSSLTFENIQLILNPLKLKLVDFKIFNESNGCINKIIFLNTIDETKNESVDLVLKLSNSAVTWEINKTISEVTIMKYIKENTNIPVPKVYSYSYNQNNSLNSEYILMEKIKGKLLHDVLPRDPIEIPKQFIEQYIEILRTLKYKIKPHWSEGIGCFDENMNIAPIKYKGDFIGPFKNAYEYYDIYFDICINELRKIKSLHYIADIMEKKRVELREKVMNSGPEVNYLNYDDKFSICHTDLNPTNIMIDPDTFKITGILDWEWASYGFDENIWDIFEVYDDKTKRQAAQEKFKHNLEEAGINISYKAHEIRTYLIEFIRIAQWLTFYLSFWLDSDVDKNISVRNYINKQIERFEVKLEKWSTYLSKI